jgi:hypothetical protein
MSNPVDRWPQWRQRFANQPKMLEVLDKLDAEIAALGTIDDITLAAVRALDTEELALKQRLVAGEITQAHHYARWSALMDRTPLDVQLASIKLTQTMIDALRRGPEAPEA